MTENLPVCDICSEQGPRWSLPAERFELAPGHFSTGAWAFCDECKLIYERTPRPDVTAALTDRALGGEKLRNTPAEFVPDLRVSMEAMYERLIEHVVGGMVEHGTWIEDCDHEEYTWHSEETTLRQPGYYCKQCGQPPPPDPVGVKWARDLFDSLNDGGTWAIPRAGLSFQRDGDSLVLIERMPWAPGMAVTERDLRLIQERELSELRRHFVAAGVPVREHRGAVFFAPDGQARARAAE